MMNNEILNAILIGVILTSLFLVVYRLLLRSKAHFIINTIILLIGGLLNYHFVLFSVQMLAIILICSLTVYILVFMSMQDKIPGQKGSISGEEPTPRRYSRVELGNGETVGNVFAGVYVGGSAGSGKTRSVIHRFMRHFGRYNFGGIIYAYKNFELVEYGLPLFNSDKCYIFAPNNPEVTVKVNPLDPSYFDDETEIRGFFQEMMDNLNRRKGGADNETTIFFKAAATGLVTGITWIMMQRYPQYCTLPHIAALCMLNDFDTLKQFLETDSRATMQAATYLQSTGDQLSGVKGTVFNFLSSFATPAICYSLYDKDRNYVDLKVNTKGDPKHLFIVNDIANEAVILPVVNSITYLAMRLLTKGETQRSYILIDEGSTLNLQGFSRKPATLRSFEVATLFSIQDHSLAIEAASEATIRAICSNLSYQYYGKANDDKTAEAYERMSPYIEKKQRSHTSANNVLANNMNRDSTTISMKEQKMYRAPDFRALGTGEFICFSDGKCKKKYFDYKAGIDRATIVPMRTVTKEQVNTNYEEILVWAKTFLIINQ